MLTLVVYAIFYPVLSSGQTEGKLFIQQTVLLDFNAENTSLILGAMVCISRIVRVFSNLLFAKVYDKYPKKIGLALSILLCGAIGCMLFGSFIPLLFMKIAVMSLGYIIILFVRDPFRLYVQDVMLENTPKAQHQTLLTMLEFGVKIGTVAIGLSFSAILLRYPMIVVMAIPLILASIEIFLSLSLYKMVASGNPHKKNVARRSEVNT